VEHSLRPRSGEYMSEEANSPLTITGAVDTEASKRALLKRTTREVRGSSSTHGKGSDNDNIDK